MNKEGLLTEQEIVELFNKMYNGDEEAREKLILRNFRLVGHIAKKYKGKGVKTEDLVSAGTIGLIRGIDTYLIDRKTTLSAYLGICIKNEMLGLILKETKHFHVLSLEQPMGTDPKDGTTVTLENIQGTEKDLLFNLYCLKEKCEIVRDSLAVLPERDKQIILMNFRFLEDKNVTHKEISKIYGKSRPWVSKRIAKSLKKLRNIEKINQLQ